MKSLKKTVIVVDGQSDVNKLRLLVDADFVITNGSEISRETLKYIEKLALSRDIIILTDPDYPGQRIRNIINNAVKGCYNAYVDRSKSVKGHKLGVAECEDEEILRALKDMIKYKEIDTPNPLTLSDLIDLGLSGQEDSFNKRLLLAEHYHLGPVNTKSLLNKLNMLNISLEEVKGVLDENRK
jgi:ribonuclease M5